MNFFMQLAITESQKSLDPITQVGCILIDKEEKVVGKGHNKLTYNMNINLKKLDKITKRKYMIHAEPIALFSLNGKECISAYCTHAPCLNCFKLMTLVGITNIYYNECFTSNKKVDLKLINIYNEMIIATKINIININTNKTFIEEALEYAKKG